MIPDAAPVGAKFFLAIDKFEDDPQNPCEHWHAQVSGRHCGHYIESVTTQGTMDDNGNTVIGSGEPM